MNLKYLGWQYRAFIKTAKNGVLCKVMHSENNSEAILATSCCYDHGVKVFEVVQEIATDQKGYHKYSSRVTICWMSKYTYQSITVKKDWLLGHLHVAKKAAEAAQKKSINWPMVNFIHTGSEIAIWVGYSFTTKSAKSKTPFSI